MAPTGISNGPSSNSNNTNNNDRANDSNEHLGTSPAFASSPFRSGSVSSVPSVQYTAPDRSRHNDDDAASSQLLDHDDDDRDPYDDRGNDGPNDWPHLRRRRSSVGARLTALTDIGGVNSIRSFTRSFQRAAGFTEVIPQRPSFIFAPDQEPIFGGPHGEGAVYDSDDIEAAATGSRRPELGPSRGTPPRFTSLLRQHLEAADSNAATSSSDNASFLGRSSGGPSSPAPGQTAPGGPNADGQQQQDDAQQDASERKSLLDSGMMRTFRAGSVSSIFGYPPHLASAAAAAEGGTPPVVGSYGSYRSYGSGYRSIDSPAGLSYGAMTGRMGVGGGDAGSPAASMAQAAALWQQQQEGGLNVPDGERPAILVKEVEEDGKIILTVEGQSTIQQTIFNSINVLIGVGLLSLPMGLKYAGWICGMAILFLAAAVTAYTARLLAKCMDLDPSVITFSDLAFISFGPRARLVTSLLFTLELLAACVALIVLFADSLDLLFPDLLTAVEWKVLCCLIMIPLNFLPMRLLSVTSIIGIVSCFSIVSIVVIDGLTKKTSPGSLIEPATTYLFPANWLTLPLSFGLLMSPWGGHSVFPNIYRDMRHPYKYAQAVKVTFSFTYILDAVTAVAGILMFGDDVMDEITANILTTSGYPSALTFCLCIFIAIIPLTKIPLNARPIITTLEVLTGVHQQAVSDSSLLIGRSAQFRGLAKIVIRVLVLVVFLVISIVFPAFDSIMAFMGSALCFTICVTLPILFHLKLFGHDLTYKDKLVQYTILTLSITISIVGTVWSFLPKSLIGLGKK